MTNPTLTPVPSPRPRHTNEVTQVRIVLGFMVDGTYQEAVHEILQNDFLVDSYSFSQINKTGKTKEGDGSVTIEPTGECEMTLKVKYHRR